MPAPPVFLGGPAKKNVRALLHSTQEEIYGGTNEVLETQA